MASVCAPRMASLWSFVVAIAVLLTDVEERWSNAADEEAHHLDVCIGSLATAKAAERAGDPLTGEPCASHAMEADDAQDALSLHQRASILVMAVLAVLGRM